MYIAFDTETKLIERGLLAPPMVCYQWHTSEARAIGATGSIAHHIDAVEQIWDSLAGDEYLIGHNVAYDMAVIEVSYPLLARLIWSKYARGQILDTMVAEQLIDITRGTFSLNSKQRGWYSLARTAERYGFSKRGDDPWRTRYGELYDVPLDQWPAEARDYAVHDAEVTLEVFLKQLDHVEWLGDLEKQTKYAFCLHLMSCWGVHTEPARVEKLREEVEVLLASVRADLLAAGLIDETGKRNVRKAQKILYDEAMRLGLEPKWTKGGIKAETKEIKHIALDEDACNLVGLPILQKYSLYATQSSLKARIEDLSQGYIYPLQARFEVLKETGRTSSKKPGPPLAGTQMQNFPRAIGARECIVPRDGMCFLGADLSMAELHTLAQACLDLFGESRLAESLNAGRDVHLELAAWTLGISYEDALARKRAEDPEILKARQEAKPVNFGFPGGMGAARFVVQARSEWGLDISLDRAKELKQLWFAAWPEMRKFFAHVSDLLGGREKISIKATSADRVRGRVGYCDGCNGFFQIPAADGVKAAMWLISKACYNEPDSPLYGRRPWNLVHDEILLEGPIGQVHEAGLELKRLMELGFNQYVPRVPTTAEPFAMMRWSKKAKPIFVNGRLVPWNEE